MRVFGSFTVPQLCMAAEVSPSNCRFYLRVLQAAGLVKKTLSCESGRAGSYDTWALVRNTGPEAPIWRKDGTVYDPNTKITHKLTRHESAAS